jgi:hypothetical protein
MRRSGGPGAMSDTALRRHFNDRPARHWVYSPTPPRARHAPLSAGSSGGCVPAQSLRAAMARHTNSACSTPNHHLAKSADKSSPFSRRPALRSRGPSGRPGSPQRANTRSGGGRTPTDASRRSDLIQPSGPEATPWTPYRWTDWWKSCRTQKKDFPSALVVPAIEHGTPDGAPRKRGHFTHSAAISAVLKVLRRVQGRTDSVVARTNVLPSSDLRTVLTLSICATCPHSLWFASAEQPKVLLPADARRDVEQRRVEQLDHGMRRGSAERSVGPLTRGRGLRR